MEEEDDIRTSYTMLTGAGTTDFGYLPDLPEGGANAFTLTIRARSGNDRAAFIRRLFVKRISGASLIVGLVETSFTAKDAGLDALDVTIVASGGRILVRVVGEAQWWTMPGVLTPP